MQDGGVAIEPSALERGSPYKQLVKKLLRKKTFYGGVIESACIAMATGYVVQLGMLCDDGVFKPACQLARPNQDLTTYPPANILRLVHDGRAHFDGFQPMDI